MTRAEQFELQQRRRLAAIRAMSFWELSLLQPLLFCNVQRWRRVYDRFRAREGLHPCEVERLHDHLKDGECRAIEAEQVAAQRLRAMT